MNIILINKKVTYKKWFLRVVMGLQYVIGAKIWLWLALRLHILVFVAFSIGYIFMAIYSLFFDWG